MELIWPFGLKWSVWPPAPHRTRGPCHDAPPGTSAPYAVPDLRVAGVDGVDRVGTRGPVLRAQPDGTPDGHGRTHGQRGGVVGGAGL